MYSPAPENTSNCRDWLGCTVIEAGQSVQPQWLVDLAFELDRLEVPLDAGTPAAQKALKDAGKGRRRTDVIKAVRFRQGRAKGVPKNREHPGTPPGNTFGNTGNTLPKTLINIEESNGNTPGNTREQSEGVFPTLRVGTPPDPEADFDPDFDDLEVF